MQKKRIAKRQWRILGLLQMSDRRTLEEGEARVLYFTYVVTQDKVITEERKQWIYKTYGPGAVDRIQAMMLKMHKESMEPTGPSH